MKPKVRLINISDNREQAWVYSRPGFDHSELDMEKIGSMDMSLNSMCMLTFEVTSSLVFRDWMFTMRPIFPWARSSRSAPLTLENAQISEEYGNSGRIYVEQVLDDIASGRPQDQAREGLPLSMSTSYTVSIDFRTCCGMIKSMKELNRDLYMVYGKLFEREIDHIKGYRTSSVRSFVDSYSIDYRQSGFNRIEVKFAMMSQLIRASNAYFRNEIWNMVCYKGYLEMGYLQQSDHIIVDMFMEPHAYEKLMKLRSHWFADWSTDMWGTMVGARIKDMDDEEFWDFIPNGSSGKDPYHRDMISRVTGEEHNLPCPIMLEAPYLVEQRLERHGHNPVIDKYMSLVSARYINDNPKNELRIQYESLGTNK